ncbi:hypothetical protein AMTRI_Chr06g176550 [Amborella trichopoda]
MGSLGGGLLSSLYAETQGFEKGSLGLGLLSRLYAETRDFLCKCIWNVVIFGPKPKHVAVIMDGNQRFARKHHLKEVDGHKFGLLSLMSTLTCCYEMGVKYVTIYAFSIDNFKRRSDEVQFLMDLLYEKIENILKDESIVNRYGIRVTFLGNLKLLPSNIREAAERAMNATAKNDNVVLSICVAYSSTNEITRAAQGACTERFKIRWGSNLTSGAIMENVHKRDEENNVIKVSDLERHMFTAGCPEPDLLIKTSGETRLSNYLLWQSSHCYLHISNALWPEFALRHMLWAVLKYQRVKPYLEKKNKKMV